MEALQQKRRRNRRHWRLGSKVRRIDLIVRRLNLAVVNRTNERVLLHQCTMAECDARVRQARLARIEVLRLTEMVALAEHAHLLLVREARDHDAVHGNLGEIALAQAEQLPSNPSIRIKRVALCTPL